MDDSNQRKDQAFSPFKYFYDEVFSIAPADQQAEFLKQLFTKDAALCASFQSFIQPPMKDVSEADTEATAASMREKITQYPWDCLFDFDPTADEYSEELLQVLARDITGKYELQLASFCKIGDLLSALQCLRIIESGTDLDWTAVEEPAAHHPDEIAFYVEAVFDDLESHFIDNIFSKQAIDEAQKKAMWYLSNPGKVYNYSERWRQLIEVFGD